MHLTKHRVVLIVAALIFLTTSYYSLNTIFIYTPDSARYVTWANSLAHFNGFTDTTEPTTSRYCVHSPLYSLLLSPIAFFFPENIVALKALNIILAVVVAVFLFMFMEKRCGGLIALISTTLFLFNPWTYFLSTQLLTEMLFAFGLIVLLYSLNKDIEGDRKRRYFHFAIISLLICIFSREIGILLLPLVVIFYAWRKHYTYAIIALFLPLILYISWYIRNEDYYAGLELPQFKNSALFFSNTLVSHEESFLTELGFRIANSFQYYVKQLITVLFFTPYNIFSESTYTPWISLIDFQSSVHNFIAPLVNQTFWFIGIVSMIFVATGMVVEFRTSKIFYIKVIFSITYIVVLLIYPVIDVRFLFPILILFFIWVGYAFQYFLQGLKTRFSNLKHRTRDSKLLLSAFVIFIILLSLPNISWTFNYISTQHGLISDPAGSFIDNQNPDIRVGHAQITIPLAAQWINEQQDSSAVVLSPYKELSLFLRNKKVQVVNIHVPANTFDLIIRDYEIRYIVLLRDVLGWGDYEYQMAVSDNYSFRHAYTAGAFEVHEVIPERVESSKIGIKKILGEFKNGNYLAVDSFITRNYNLIKSNSNLLLFAAVNKHVLGELDSSLALMQDLYLMPQGLVHSKLASLHQTAIHRRKLLKRLTNPPIRANILLTLGLNYWELGFKELARHYSQLCIETDSNYALAYAYTIMYNLKCGDTLTAFVTNEKLKRNFPNTEYSFRIDSLMQSYVLFRKASTSKKKAILLEKIMDNYSSLVLDEMALECAYLALKYDHKRMSVHKKIAEIYTRNRLYVPALNHLKRYQQYDSTDKDIAFSIRDLRTRLYLN